MTKRTKRFSTGNWTAAALLAGVAASAGYAADTILEIYGTTLTSYKAGASVGQDVQPRFDQRGVGVDGVLHSPSPFGWAIAGNPFSDAPAPSCRHGDICLSTGAYAPTEVDLALPATGPRWVIGRTFNSVQGGGDSDGYQGINWFQTSQPELAFYDDAGGNANDVLYLVYGADRYVEFKRTATDATTFKGKNGAAGVIEFDDTTTPDTYVYYAQDGTRVYFFGDDTSGDRADWQIWKIVDPAGNAAFVGHMTDPTTAASSGYNADRSIAVAYDASGAGGSHRYTYTYTTLDSVSRLTRVKAESMTGSTWSSPGTVTEVGRVDYAYYQTGDNTYGDNGNLKLVTVTTPLTDSGVSLERHTHYRYWKGTFNDSTNPGYPNSVRYVLEPEGARRYDWDEDADLDEGFLTATNVQIDSYAAMELEYNSADKVDVAAFASACGCGGGGTGAHEFVYAESTSYSTDIADTTYDTAWGTRAVTEQPDGTFVTQYFDEVGQSLSRVITDADPATGSFDYWATGVVRDSSGRVESIHTPANHTAYTHDTTGTPTGSFTRSTTVGLVMVYQRASSGDETGLLEATKHKEGTSGTAYFDSWTDFGGRVLDVSGQGMVGPVITERRAYHTEGSDHTTSANYDATTMSYTWHHATDTNIAYVAMKSATTTRPTVSTGKNGSNTAEDVTRYFRGDGTPVFVKHADDRIDYTGYEGGLVTMTTLDPKDGGAGASSGLLAIDDEDDYSLTLAGDGWEVITNRTYDAQGRASTTTAPDGRVSYTYHSKLLDGRMVTISVPRRTGSGPYTYFGPASYSVSNLEGHAEFSGTIAIASAGVSTAITSWIDETDDDPILALGLGALARMSTTIYGNSGCKPIETRAYFDIPGSGAGTEGTNYDATTYGYDSMGRRWRSKQPTGTITRTVYDELGRAIQSWSGTNDNSFSGGEASGPDDMVKVSAMVYDGGSSGGNSLVTKTTSYVDSSTGHDTDFLSDYRGRRIVSDNPIAPHSVAKYDNLGRVVAVGLYSSNSGLDAGDDPTSLATNRVGLSKTFYDEQGRAWKTTRHKVDDADGSDDDNLESLTWFDAMGRVVKADGEQLTKTVYDRLGRTTRSYVLAKDNDTVYADVDDVAGDHVMEETVTIYESEESSNVIVRAVIGRHHNDLTAGTTGALDTDSDESDGTITGTNIKGRIAITAMWHDALDRTTDVIAYGTNGIVGDGSTSGGDFTRPGSPAGSSTALLTTTDYNDDGTVHEVTDPKSYVTRFVYDDAGRRTAVIANYVDGTPSGVTGADDVHTRYVFTDGLQTKMWVDLDGDNVEDSDDQVTTYTYGVVKGTNPGDSKIGAGHLLQKITYPDSSGGTDVVTFAYNARSQEIYSRDQAGNVFESVYDDGGRLTDRKVTTLAGGFDGAVRRISRAYNSRGQLETVTQYDAASSGSVVNEVEFTYSDWPGVLKSIAQDRDSAVGTGSNDYVVEYTLEKNDTGRNTVRRTFEKVFHHSTLEQSTVYTYGYAGADLDDELSRVSRVKVGGTVVADYAYTGVGHLVGIDYPEPDVFWATYGASTGSYPVLDRFNRLTSAIWTKDLATDKDFYDVDYTYDDNSNITRQVDNIHFASTNRVFDAAYTMDALNRLADAVEGNWNGSSINVKSREQHWTLTQTGNWELNQQSHNGDGDYIDTDELNDDGTFSKANEWTARDIDDNGGDDYTLTYDAVGNLTDDGEDYEYVYDAFGRLRELRKTSNQALVAEYTYNGLGHRIGWHYDVDGDGTVENTSDDPWFYFAYDEAWRIVAVFRGSDSEPKELFVNHKAGLDGYGASSALDAVILRDKDANSGGDGWAGAPDGTREERVYYVQVPGTRGDVVALITSTGTQAGQTRYSAYGVPFGLPPGDLDADGDVDAADSTVITSLIAISGYRAAADLDLDGDVDATDSSTVSGNSGMTLGRSALSLDPKNSTAAGSGNRKGYAGYEHDGAVQVVTHVRNRPLHTGLGRWTQRDPASDPRSRSLYQYALSDPIVLLDAFGTVASYPCNDPSGCNWIHPIGGGGGPIGPGGGIPGGGNGAGGGGGIGGFIPPGEPGGGPMPPGTMLDVLEVRCRSILPGQPAQHCWNYCRRPNHGAGGTHRWYSLLNQPGPIQPLVFGIMTPLGCTDCIPSPPDIQINRTVNAQADSIWPPHPQITVATVTGPGLCDRAAQIYSVNAGVPAGMLNSTYCANDCNSNWYASSFFACATGAFPLLPFNAYGAGAGSCSGRVPFNCPPGMPGVALAYSTGLWPFSGACP